MFLTVSATIPLLDLEQQW